MKNDYTVIQSSRGSFALYFSESDKERPCLLCLHGGPGFDSTYLRSSLPNSLYDSFRLIFIDLKGDGHSKCPDENLNLSLEDYAKDITALFEQLQLKEQNLVGLYGHSFGGFVATKTLSLFPELFQFAILSNTMANFDHAKNLSAVFEKLNIPKEVYELEEKFQRGVGTDEDFLKMNLLYARLYYPEFEKEKAEKLINQGIMSAKPYENFLKSILPNFDLIQDAKQISCPTLILGSKLDHITPWDGQRALNNLIKNSDAHCFAEAGHFPFVRKSEEYEAPRAYARGFSIECKLRLS